jgi:hypothetical protein
MGQEASQEAVRPEGNRILVRFRSRQGRGQEAACFLVSLMELFMFQTQGVYRSCPILLSRSVIR